MEVIATHKFLRSSPRKVRLLLPQLKGLPADQALAQLRLMPQAASRPVSKVIRSAMANAENNYSLDPKTLVVARASADGGPILKRFQPRAQGRASNLWRRTAHLTVVLKDVPVPKASVTDKVKSGAAKVTPKRPAKKAAVRPKKATPKTTPKAPLPKNAAKPATSNPAASQPPANEQLRRRDGSKG